jgi:hypothetical protein
MALTPLPGLVTCLVPPAGCEIPEGVNGTLVDL